MQSPQLVNLKGPVLVSLQKEEVDERIISLIRASNINQEP